MSRLLKLSGLSLAALMLAGSAQAATIGLVCDGVVQLVVAPSVEEANQCAAALTGNCTEGFRIDGGYFAIATSAEGSAVGTSAGASSLEGAEQTAMSSCAQGGDGDCSISVSGNDDGNTYNSCQQQ